MNRTALWLTGLIVVAMPPAFAADGPSRAPVKGCVWEQRTEAALGLALWAQRCDFGFRKIDFVVVKHSLAIRYSDGGAADPLIDVLDMRAKETAEAGIRRLFAAGTEQKLVKRCVLAPYRQTVATPAGVRRYTFVPDAAYSKELAAKADPNEVPEPPCGEWGDAPDGIQYFEAQPDSGARKVLFVRAGQDQPLFDEQTLRLLPAR